MDPELRLLDLVRRDWWILVIVLCIIWAIECHLEGNSVIETIEAPLLVVAWGGLIRSFLSIDGRFGTLAASAERDEIKSP